MPHSPARPRRGRHRRPRPPGPRARRPPLARARPPKAHPRRALLTKRTRPGGPESQPRGIRPLRPWRGRWWMWEGPVRDVRGGADGERVSQRRRMQKNGRTSLQQTETRRRLPRGHTQALSTHATLLQLTGVKKEGMASAPDPGDSLTVWRWDWSCRAPLPASSCDSDSDRLRRRAGESASRIIAEEVREREREVLLKGPALSLGSDYFRVPGDPDEVEGVTAALQALHYSFSGQRPSHARLSPRGSPEAR